MLANVFAQMAGKKVVDRMPGPSGDDAPFDGFAQESHVADNVEQFVAGAFVLPN